MAIPEEAPDLNSYRPGDAGDYRVISRGDAAVTYQAFPDVARLASGDLLAVFYAGYTHISLPDTEYPRGGRICMVRSTDDGRTWSEPAVLYDGPLDDRDPHAMQLADGTVVVSFFTYRPIGNGSEALNCYTVSSTDEGHTWATTPQPIARGFACSAPVRELNPGLWLQAVYAEQPVGAPGTVLDGGVVLPSTYAAVARRVNGVWQAPVPLISSPDSDAPLTDGTEADVIALRDGRLMAVIRSDVQNMQYAYSSDEGVTWTSPADIGFVGHCPQLTRLRSGAIVLTHRYPMTALHVSDDDGNTWGDAFQVDDVIGAYPTALQLLDDSAMVVYYEEGTGSAVRIKRFSIVGGDVVALPPP